MTFRQRLMYYGLGLAIGTVGVSLFFKDRGCAWTPGNRVMTNIAHSQIMISDSMRCVLKTNGIHDDDIFEIFKTGSVNFSESNPHDSLRKYRLEGVRASNNKPFEVNFIVYSDSLSELAGLVNATTTQCTGLSREAGKIFTMPEKTVKKILKTKEVITSDSLKTVIKNYKLSEGQAINMIQFGKIDFERSEPMAKPNALYFLTYKEFELSVELAQDRAYLLSIAKR